MMIARPTCFIVSGIWVWKRLNQTHDTSLYIPCTYVPQYWFITLTICVWNGLSYLLTPPCYIKTAAFLFLAARKPINYTSKSYPCWWKRITPHHEKLWLSINYFCTFFDTNLFQNGKKQAQDKKIQTKNLYNTQLKELFVLPIDK